VPAKVPLLRELGKRLVVEIGTGEQFKVERRQSYVELAAKLLVSMSASVEEKSRTVEY
jgi:hypothetical protein